MSLKFPFHIALPVHDLQIAKSFYLEHFNCSIGRSSDQWIDLNFYGHQFVLHEKKGMIIDNLHHNPVDGKEVPVPHCGVVLNMDEWNQLAHHLKDKKVKFVIDPYIRFAGDVGEQATMFLLDPSGNALEFKGFKNMDQLFAY